MKSNGGLAVSLVVAVFLWGGNNAGVKFLVGHWPPVFVGATRFLCAGLLLLAVLRWTTWLGRWQPTPRDLQFQLWTRGGFSLALYIVTFNWALRFTSASHVALILGASPLWALAWERDSGPTLEILRKYAAALVALVGVGVLLWPSLKGSAASWSGEALAVLASLLWTNYSRQCRTLSRHLNGAEITAHAMWRAALWLSPLAAWEMTQRHLDLRADVVCVQGYCILAGGVAAFALWTNALRHWQTSQVLLFNNLIPLSTMTWAHVWLGEPITHTFGFAMVLIGGGVTLGQAPWRTTRPQALPPQE
jgi:drug/metabolite transporter (DMT)-like permease